jgi:hypothetical protein
VAAFLAFWARAVEGKRDKLVNVELVAASQEYGPVAVHLPGWMHEFALLVTAVAAHLAKLADLISIMPGNRKPAGVSKVIHVSLLVRFTVPGAVATAAGLSHS